VYLLLFTPDLKISTNLPEVDRGRRNEVSTGVHRSLDCGSTQQKPRKETAGTVPLRNAKLAKLLRRENGPLHPKLSLRLLLFF
jgi:hypothetical protein